VLHFHTVTVKDIRRETEDCVSVSFNIPEDLRSQFQYKAGQYLTLRKYLNGEEIRRSYSLCSSPLDNEWRVAVKNVTNGKFSAYALNEMKVGDEIELMPPMGAFHTEINSANKKKYVGIAAGSGITPVLSIIKTVLKTEQQSSFTLVYGNKNRNSIIFREEVEALKNKYIDRFRVMHVLSREVTDAAINSGRIDATKCEELFTKFIDVKADEFFICGPEDMIFCVKDFLMNKGIPKKHVHFELFTAPNQKAAVQEVKTEDAGPKSKVTVILDGRSFDFDLTHEGENILDAAIRLGADLPYSCKSGVCSTCRAKLVEGEVDMEVNYALEDDEVKQGFILTCQSHPKTPKVVIDYDAKS
jgi:ring-1,2-phenylacetyl-CoA epoxidase subunit PaaE